MRFRKAKRFQLLALLAVLALVLAACGDGRDDGDTSSSGSGDDTDETTPEGEEGAFEIDTSGCETDPSSVTIEGDTITFGTSLPQSGLYSAFAEILRGEQAYLSYLNEELGGVDIGGTKYKVELLAKDDEYQPDATVTNVNGLIQDDGVFSLFNVVGTRNNLAIRDAVSVACVPDLFAATGSPAWGNPSYPWVLGTFLVPYSLEMQAFYDYLTENKPNATVAILQADDDFGRAYTETFESLIEGSEITVVQRETYNPEGADVAAQVTSLAASGADTFILAGTLLACPAALTEAKSAGWEPLVYMSGTCTSKTLMDAAVRGGAGDGVMSVSPLMDPNDPAAATNEAMVLYKEKIAQYQSEADAGNGIVAYGWTAGAALADLLSRLEGEPSRLSIMQTARTLTDMTEIGLQIPGASWTVGADDWFLGEQFNLVQYSVAEGYFVTVGDMLNYDDQTEEITPPDLING